MANTDSAMNKNVFWISANSEINQYKLNFSMVKFNPFNLAVCDVRNQFQ